MLCFLWKGDSVDTKNAKVALKDLAIHKQEGGLGNKIIDERNNVCILKNLWLLFIKAGSLWVSWSNNYYIKSRRIWSLPIVVVFFELEKNFKD